MRKFWVLAFSGCKLFEYGIADAFLTQRNTLIRDQRHASYSSTMRHASTLEVETNASSKKPELTTRGGEVFANSVGGSKNDENKNNSIRYEGLESSIATEKKQHFLDLDSKGRLVVNEKDVILDGITPSEWSTSRSSIAEESEVLSSSLFLITHHSAESAQHETELGKLVTCNRLLACSRINRYWMGPAFGVCAKDVPIDTQFLLVELSEDGPYALLLPLVDDGFRASLHYGGNNINLVCHSESGDVAVTSSGMRALYVSVGDDPFELLKKGFAAVAKELGTFATLDQKKLPPS
eukprot:4467802-Ditylum_brightwellii.AAC.1